MLARHDREGAHTSSSTRLQHAPQNLPLIKWNGLALAERSGLGKQADRSCPGGAARRTDPAPLLLRIATSCRLMQGATVLIQARLQARAPSLHRQAH